MALRKSLKPAFVATCPPICYTRVRARTVETMSIGARQR
jgi:hypothetical protein